jgi:hypothetical protein
MNAYILHPGDEIEDIAAAVAVTETVPYILTEAYTKLRGIAAFVNGTGATQAISASFEFVGETIVSKDLLHGYGRFHGLEVNKR